MKFWNYIGEFFLFRWLFGWLKPNGAKNDLSESSRNDSNDDVINGCGTDFTHGNRYEKSYSNYDNQDYNSSRAYDDFLDEQDEYDMMDDDF